MLDPIFRGPKKLQFMVIMKDDTHHINNKVDISTRPDIDLLGVEHTFADTGHTMPDIRFTLQQKPFIMSLFAIEVPSASSNTPPIAPASVTPISMQTKVQVIMTTLRPPRIPREIIGIMWSIASSQRSIKKPCI